MVEKRDFIRIIREQSLKFQENRRGTLAFSREYDILMMVKDSQNSRRNDMRLSDSIETFIKTLLAEDEPEVELKRNELAEYFGCAPSQINYVLATRFSPDHGYLIESRRGGGGYIRIMRLASTSREELLQSLYQRIGMSISSADAMKIVDHLESEKIVSSDEAKLMKAALSPQAVPLPLTMKDALCAGTLRSMILALAKRRPNG